MTRINSLLSSYGRAKTAERIFQLIRFTRVKWPKFVIAFGLIALLAAIFSPYLSPDGIGIKADKSVTRTVERDAKGQRAKTVTTTKKESGKTVWDWLSLLGVPLTLAGLGYWLQTIQQGRQSDKANEEILQVYYDRLSALLVDKNLIAIAAKKKARESAKKKAEEEGVNTEASEGLDAKPEEEELLDSALDVIRARTLSILRRFGDDLERKRSVIRFLNEADFISKLKLNLSLADLNEVYLIGANLRFADLHLAYLSCADLSCANLSFANLSFAYLTRVNLRFADLSDTDISFAHLSFANLREANLRFADLSFAYLNFANLSGANLSGANLSEANLIGANLNYANLSNTDISEAKNVTEEQLTDALLCKTKLPPGINLDPDRDCELARLKAEQEARLKAEREARLKAKQEARLDPERVARRKAEQESGETSA